MTPIADMVRKMLEKGVAPDAIVLAVEGAEVALLDQLTALRHVTEGVTSRDEALERRREADRLRKQRSRDKQQMSRDERDMSRDVTNASLSKESKKEEIKEERGERKRDVTRGQRLPDDWQPTPQDEATAHELLGPDRTRAELEKFRDHWKQQPGSKGVKLDWNAAWRNWIRRAAEYRGGRNGNGTGANRTTGAAGPPQTGADAVLAGMGRLASRVAQRQLAERQQGLDLAGKDDANRTTEADGFGAYRGAG